jgi:ribosomal protein S27AE
MKPTECPFCGSTYVLVKEKMQGKTRWRCGKCNKHWTVKIAQEPDFTSNKKEGIFNWREWSKHLTERQALHEKASWSQDTAAIKLDTPYPYIVWKPLADIHLGAIGTDYKTLVDISDNVLSIPYLYISLLGDEEDNFVSFKSQLAVVQQILSPEEQDSFVESWLTELSPKILFSTWGNHAEFEEKATGRNTLKKLLNHNVIYFNGIGVCILEINGIKYKIVPTHKTRYGSSFNKTHGLKQLARKEIPDADVYLMGHIHDPAVEYSFERGMWQIFAVMGTLKHNDGFAKRYFSAFSAREDFAFVLDTKQKKVLVFPTLDDALGFAKMGNEKVANA